MNKKIWKKANPRSFGEAIGLCKDYALAVHNRSIDRIAELANENSKFTIYDWERHGSIPGRKILAFQHACGCDFITRYLAHSAGKLLIDIPHGRLPEGEDVRRLQAVLNEAVGALLNFAAGRSDADQVAGEINASLEALAWHRENVLRAVEPELELGHD